jgi:hypothetical protein
MSTSQSTAEHRFSTDPLTELSAQLELLVLNAAIEANARGAMASGEITDAERLRLTALDALLKEVQGAFNWVGNAGGEDSPARETLSRLAERLTQTVIDMENPRIRQGDPI